VVAAGSTVAAAAGVTVAEEKIFTEERGREVVQLSREMVLWLLEVGMMVRSQVMKVVVAEGHGGERKQKKDCLQEK
jgi:hypothetical protein